jgi:regulator of sirC expression with transglutaminase-like and TPR domain
VFALLPAFAAASFAQEGKPAADEATIKRLVKLLGDDDFTVREKAEGDLRAIGEPAVPFLREALKGKDFEAATRARRLIGAIRWERVRGRFVEFAALPDDKAEAQFEPLVFDLARLGEPELDDAAAKKKLDEYGRAVASLVGNRKDPADLAFALRHVLEIQEKFTGKTVAEDEYNKPEHSFLPRVIEKKQGLPIALSVVYVLVGKRAKVPVAGVGAPGHFLCKVADADPAKEVFIDAYNNRTFTRAEFDTVFGPGATPEQREAVLAATPPKAMLRRMVQNLIGAYQKSGDNAGLEKAQALAQVLDAAGK